MQIKYTANIMYTRPVSVSEGLLAKRAKSMTFTNKLIKHK